MQEMANKGFYALHDGKTPMRVAFGGIAVNIALSIILVKGFRVGLGGLAVSASVAANVIGFTLLYRLHKRTGGILTKDFAVFSVKTFISVSVMGIVVFAINRFIPFDSKLLDVAIPVLAGAAVYFVTSALCRTEEISELAGIIKSLLKKGVRK